MSHDQKLGSEQAWHGELFIYFCEPLTLWVYSVYFYFLPIIADNYFWNNGMFCFKIDVKFTESLSVTTTLFLGY